MQLCKIFYAFIGAMSALSIYTSSIYAGEPEFDLENCINEIPLTAEGAKYNLSSLDRVYHGGNKLADSAHEPRCMTPEQKIKAEKRLQLLNSNPDEGSSLNARHPDKALKLMSLRNSDNDEYLDFRIKENGAFIQNDDDADNDGIPNLFDPRPQIPGSESDKVARNDSNDNNLPDHLDWSNTKIYDFTPEDAKNQERIFQDYGVVLVEAKGSDFRSTIIEMTDDVLQVFSRLLKKYKVKKRNVLKSITYAESYDFVPEGEEPLGILAEVSPVNGQVIIYNDSLLDMKIDRKKLIAPFITYIHELAHIIQNAMDYPQNQEELLISNTHKSPRKFAIAVNRLGWDIDINDTVDLSPSTLFVDHGNEAIPVRTIYNNTELDMVGLYENCDPEELERDDDIVGCYSYAGIREWHAEYIANTVLRVMFERLPMSLEELRLERKLELEEKLELEGKLEAKLELELESLSLSKSESEFRSEAATFIRKAQCEMNEDWGGWFYDYKNANDKAFKRLKRDMRLKGKLSNRYELIDRLNSKYIIEPFENSEVVSDSSSCAKSYAIDS
jgi:hypothetical protein